MTDVKTEVVRLYPATAVDNAGVRIGYIEGIAKAAKSDTITLTNANTIISADLRFASVTEESIVITDNNDAATAGVAVYVKTKNGKDAWFEFVSPTNADGTGLLSATGSTYFIADLDAAATDGVALYFDEDGTGANNRLLIVSASAKDMYVPVPGTSKRIKLTHDANAATKGVQVYFDENAASTHGRLLFVSPTNANGASLTVSANEVGSNETATIATNAITLTGDSVGTVSGTIVYK